MIWVIFLILTCFSHVAFRKLYNMEIHCFIICIWIQNYPFSIHKFNHLPVMNNATINIHVKKKLPILFLNRNDEEIQNIQGS